MPFMVIYRTGDGSERHEQAQAIDEAALFVEQLRNTEGIDQIRIFRMEEISFAFRPYYKVELGPPRPAEVVPDGGLATPVPPATTASTTPSTTPSVAASTTPSVAAPTTPVVPADVDDDAPAPEPVVAPPMAANGDAASGARRGLFGR